MDPNLNHKKFAILTIYKNIVKKFMTIVLLLKKSLILLKGGQSSRVLPFLDKYIENEGRGCSNHKHKIF